jgi:hypothetical protein
MATRVMYAISDSGETQLVSLVSSSPPFILMTFSGKELTFLSATLTTLVSTGDDSSVRMCPLPPFWLSLAKPTNLRAVVCCDEQGYGTCANAKKWHICRPTRLMAGLASSTRFVAYNISALAQRNLHSAHFLLFSCAGEDSV